MQRGHSQLVAELGHELGVITQGLCTQPLWPDSSCLLGPVHNFPAGFRCLPCLTTLLWEKQQAVGQEQVTYPGWPQMGQLQNVRFLLDAKTRF